MLFFPRHTLTGQVIHWYKKQKGLIDMRDRRKEILKKLEKRRKDNKIRSSYKTNYVTIPNYEEPYHHEQTPTIFSNTKNGHPLFNKEIFLLKIFVSACLILSAAIIYKHPSEKLEPVRQTISKIMENEFQFALVADWYEKTFGKPLALLPDKSKTTNTKQEYALPASAKILEGFDHDKQGVIIQTKNNAAVQAIMAGLVIFTGEKEKLGKTVIIQHADKSETWYAHLSKIDATIYDKVEVGDTIGVVSSTDNQKTGEFYFAIKKGEQFIDPIQVIKFE